MNIEPVEWSILGIFVVFSAVNLLTRLQKRQSGDLSPEEQAAEQQRLLVWAAGGIAFVIFFFLIFGS